MYNRLRSFLPLTLTFMAAAAHAQQPKPAEVGAVPAAPQTQQKIVPTNNRTPSDNTGIALGVFALVLVAVLVYWRRMRRRAVTEWRRKR